MCNSVSWVAFLHEKECAKNRVSLFFVHRPLSIWWCSGVSYCPLTKYPPFICCFVLLNGNQGLFCGNVLLLFFTATNEHVRLGSLEPEKSSGRSRKISEVYITEKVSSLTYCTKTHTPPHTPPHTPIHPHTHAPRKVLMRLIYKCPV